MTNMRRAIGALVGFAVLATVVALVSAATQLASAADLSVSVDTFAQARATPTPDVGVKGVFTAAGDPELDGVGLTLDPGTGTFAATNNPSWSAATSIASKWTVDSANDAAAETNILGSAVTYSVLGAAVTNSGGAATTLSGDLGVSSATGTAGGLTGFPPGIVNGNIHNGDAEAFQARTDMVAAYDYVAGLAATGSCAGDSAGVTYLPGVYYSAGATALTGTMYLDAQNDPDAVFIFNIDAAMNTAAASKMSLKNGAQAGNVFWRVAGAVGIGANATVSGSIMALGAVTVGDGASFNGRALSIAAVTVTNNPITISTASLAQFPWMSQSSYLQASYQNIAKSPASFSGLCLLCSDSALLPSGVVARMEVRGAGSSRRYWITLGTVSNGIFTQIHEVKVTNDNTAPVNKVLRLSYNVSTFTMTATFDGSNTLTLSNVPAPLRSNSSAGLIAWQGSSTRMYDVDARKPVA